jgi:hypothetical protein
MRPSGRNAIAQGWSNDVIASISNGDWFCACAPKEKHAHTSAATKRFIITAPQDSCFPAKPF